VAQPPAGFAAYYAATREGGPRATLLRALDAFAAEPAPAPRLALDLGCGTGRDTVELLRRGWRVLAVDAEADAIAGLVARTEALSAGDRLETAIARFEAIPLPPCDLVNSSFALPLCGPDAFPGLWDRVRAALRPGGRIACQLFGPHDSWAARHPPPAIHDRPAIEALLTGFAVELLEEEEADSVTPRGQAKHWHIFHLVARRI
jgi:SAM-dependent methyltransferase